MPHPEAQFDLGILDVIEHSPVGAVPHTPSHVDALRRLYASHQVYANADHKGGHVTARSLGARPAIVANNLAEFLAGTIDVEGLEANARIFDRYVQSLPTERHVHAETFRGMVIGRPAHHRAKHGVAAVHDPLHTLFFAPGAGPNPGLPGNYLHGAVYHAGADDATGSWVVHVHDSDDGAARFDAATLPEALEKMQELIASAPFHLEELGALGFRMT